MIEIAAGISGQQELLSEGGEPPQVPARTDEGALGVLAVDPEDGEAVGLKLHIPADHRPIEAKAGVDRRQRDRNLLLHIVDAQALERPAGDADVGRQG